LKLAFGPRGWGLAALFVAAGLSACVASRASMLPAAATFEGPETAAPFSEEETLWREANKKMAVQSDSDEATKVSALLWDAKLALTAHELAVVAAETGEAGAPDVLLEMALDRRGVAARPAAARSFSGPADAFAEAPKQAGVALARLRDQGFSHAGIGLARREDGSFAVVLVALRRDVVLTAPLPRRVGIGETVRLEGRFGDEIGRLRLWLRAPNGIIHNEPLPALAGFFHLPFKLHARGGWTLELAAAEIEGGWRTVLRAEIEAEAASEPVEPRGPIAATPENFDKIMAARVAALRRLYGRAPFSGGIESETELAAWVKTEAEALTASVTAVQREVDVRHEAGFACGYVSTWAPTLGGVLAQNIVRPSYLRLILDSDAVAYQAHAVPSGGGWRAGEIVCRKQEDEGPLLARITRTADREDYRRELSAKLVELMRFELVEREEETLARWLLAESLEALDKLGGLPILLVHGRGKDGPAKGSPEAKAARSIADDIYVTLWELAAVYRRELPEDGPERGALTLVLLQAMLHQDRPEDCLHEIHALASKNPELAALSRARITLASGWIAAYLGRYDEAVQFLLKSIKEYEPLGYEPMVRQLAVAVVLLYRLSGGSPEDIPVGRAKSFAPAGRRM